MAIPPIETFKKESADLRKEVRERTINYLSAAFGIVAGLAWNEAVKSLIEAFFPQGDANSVLAKFVYAIAVTLIIVFITVYLEKIMRKNGGSE